MTGDERPPLSDEERLYRDLWLAELWATVPEYHEPPPLPRRIRRQLKHPLPTPPRKPR